MHSISVLAAFLIMAPPKVEGPYIHGKLAVYVVRGPDSVQTESISKTMERRSAENADAAIFEYQVRGDARPLHSSYVKKK